MIEFVILSTNHHNYLSKMKRINRYFYSDNVCCKFDLVITYERSK